MSVHLAHLQQLPQALYSLLLVLATEQETEQCAQRFSQTILHNYLNQPQPNPLQIQLSGPLGAGKTTFTRAFIRALGYTNRVKSPTYTLVEPYSLSINQKKIDVYHFDLYRLEDPIEWLEAGFNDYFQVDTLCLIEWPEKAIGILPLPDLLLQFHPSSESRKIECYAFSKLGKKCLENY